mmetsp:Transcript_13078/g.38950  ORF Transcript_13078/g.38950 Transcript_13078/m.38950 type:complete len:216 (+) Transcript_13078:624-1271(+)
MDLVPLAALAMDACFVEAFLAASGSTLGRLAEDPKASSWSRCCSASWAQTFSAPAAGADERPGNTSQSARPYFWQSFWAHSSATYSETACTARRRERAEGPLSVFASGAAAPEEATNPEASSLGCAPASSTAATRSTLAASHAAALASSRRTSTRSSPRSRTSQRASSGPSSPLESSTTSLPSRAAPAASTWSSGTNLDRVSEAVSSAKMESRGS